MPPWIPPPWLDFLLDVDHLLGRSVEVHCLGGFVLGVLHELPRPTGDVDFVEIAPSEAGEELLLFADEGSELSGKYGLRFHRVTIAEYPGGYASRLVDLTPRGFRPLRLRASEVHDLILAKLRRNGPRDRADVEFLARRGVINRRVLEKRFEAELRPYVLNAARHVAVLRV